MSDATPKGEMLGGRPARRAARLAVMPEVIAALVQGRFEVVENPVPRTARIRGGAYHPEMRAFIVYLEDESFDLVPYGEILPLLPGPVVRRLDK